MKEKLERVKGALEDIHNGCPDGKLKRILGLIAEDMRTICEKTIDVDPTGEGQVIEMSNMELARIGAGMVMARPGVDQRVGFMICGILAHVVTNIPEKDWNEMVVASKVPCGEQDCTCEVMLGRIMDSLDELRDDATMSGVETA